MLSQVAFLIRTSRVIRMGGIGPVHRITCPANEGIEPTRRGREHFSIFPESSLYRFERHEVDLARCELRRDGVVVALPPRAFALLALLLRHRDRVLTKGELLATLWPATVVTKDCLPHAVMTLRRALGDDAAGSRFIVTVRGRGYRFVRTVESPELRERSAVDILRAARAALVDGDRNAALDIVTMGLRSLSS